MKQIWIWQLEPFTPFRSNRAFRQLKEFIRERGFMHQAIVIQCCSKYIILDGVWRVLAARSIGMYLIPVIVSRFVNDPVEAAKIVESYRRE